MNNIKKPVFNADAAEEYFSDLLAYYRNIANDIFRRDNDGRHASGQIYSAEYQKFLGMQAAMREVLEYFGKYDLREQMMELPIGRCAGCDNWYKGHCASGPCATMETDPGFYCGNFSPKKRDSHETP